MSRYTLLLLLNLPFVIAGIVNALVSFKLKRSTVARFIGQLTLWVIMLIGLVSAQPLYEWLFSQKLTVSEPLSVFDVIQITAIIIVFYIAGRSTTKVMALEKQVQELHQELSIILSKRQ